MKKVVALFGKSGAGKDSLKKEILKLRPDFNDVVRSTTRPRRLGEKEGKDYKFYGDGEMAIKIYKDEMLECGTFRDWVYGTERASLRENAINIGSWDPEALCIINDDNDIDCLNIYIYCDGKTRLIRSLERVNGSDEDVAEIIRRYSADEKDFQDIQSEFDYLSFTNGKDTSLQELAEQIVKVIDLFFDGNTGHFR